MKEENSFKSILKGVSTFGGVQVFQILVNLIRGKFVAMFLGPEGMGISSLYTTACNTLNQFASMGLNLAIVKGVAANRDNEEALSATIRVARRLVMVTSLTGAFLCMALSPILSKWSFGSYDYTIPFMVLSLMVFFTLQGKLEYSILQGLHAVKRLSYSSLVGAVVGLMFGVPLYYFFGNAGIVPAMVVLAFITYIYFRQSVGKTIVVEKMKVSLRQHKKLVKSLLLMGIILMASDLFGTLVTYLINLVIREFGSVADVGLYQSANSMTNQYVGLVFSAMAMDYFPRLTAVKKDPKMMSEVVNRQYAVVAMIVAPLVCLLILTTPLIIRILLTKEFLPVSPLIRWMGLAIVFRAMAYPMGYISFAHDNKKVFFWTEGVFGNVLNLVVSTLMYLGFGLVGLGIGMVITEIVSIIAYVCITGHFFNYRISQPTLRLATLYCLFPIAVFTCSILCEGNMSVWLMGGITMLCCIISIIGLKRLIRK